MVQISGVATFAVTKTLLTFLLVSYGESRWTFCALIFVITFQTILRTFHTRFVLHWVTDCTVCTNIWSSTAINAFLIWAGNTFEAIIKVTLIAWKTGRRNVYITSLAFTLTRETLIGNNWKRITFRTLLTVSVLSAFNASWWTLNYCLIEDEESTIETHWNTFTWRLFKEKLIFAHQTVRFSCTFFTV